MSDEEFVQALKEWGVDINFKTPKDKLYKMYCIAYIYHKKLEIIKMSKRKCYRKVIQNRGLETSKWATMRNYNDELKSNKYEIIEVNII
jgi:hypothetical protein